jgi:hypothetical protein
MRIVDKIYKHTCRGLPYERKDLTIRITLDEQDLPDPKMFERFMYVEVSQIDYPNDRRGEDYPYTWFKGSRTNSFRWAKKMRDKQKAMIIEKINQFLIDNKNESLIFEEYKPIDI